MPPSAGACHTIEADCRPDCGRAGDRSSIITAIGWRCEAFSLIIRPVSADGNSSGVGVGVGLGVGVGVGVGVGDGVGVGVGAGRRRAQRPAKPGWLGDGLTDGSGGQRARGQSRHEHNRGHAEHGRTPAHRRLHHRGSPRSACSGGPSPPASKPGTPRAGYFERVIARVGAVPFTGASSERCRTNEDSMADERPIDEQNGIPASDASAAVPVPSRPRRSTMSDHPLPGEPAPAAPLEGEVVSRHPQPATSSSSTRVPTT